jgi:hypothetical protein
VIVGSANGFKLHRRMAGQEFWFYILSKMLILFISSDISERFRNTFCYDCNCMETESDQNLFD